MPFLYLVLESLGVQYFEVADHHNAAQLFAGADYCAECADLNYLYDAVTAVIVLEFDLEFLAVANLDLDFPCFAEA